VIKIKFELNDKESKRVRKWSINHDYPMLDENGVSKSATGGRLTFKFIPTGIGTIKKVKCSCGKKLDLTKYEKW
jgi:hypothetical protein